MFYFTSDERPVYIVLQEGVTYCELVGVYDFYEDALEAVTPSLSHYFTDRKIYIAKEVKKDDT